MIIAFLSLNFSILTPQSLPILFEAMVGEEAINPYRENDSP